MGMFSEIARSGAAEDTCKILERKIEEYKESPTAVKALKEVGREVLAAQPDASHRWWDHYQALFKE